ncbi:MAG: hypothetical protein LQ346_007383 [Caloplaca aetnensis]|nr:MAG: hypothetical protein LQ346_007383 [Caloplaca aetnensis]
MDDSGLKDGLLVNRAYSGKDRGLGYHSIKADQEKSNNAKSRWPHALNVVTNFSKPPQLAQRAGDSDRRFEQDAVDAFRKGHNRMNSSADIKTPDKYKRRNSKGEGPHRDLDGKDHDEALGLHFHDFENTRKAPSPPRNTKGPINNLRRASSKMTTLSPSDRPIVIGISIPSDRLDQHTLSPDVGPTPVGVPSRQYATDRRPPDAPTVIITPAKAEPPWSAGFDDNFKPGRRRAPSSLYSRATHARGTPNPAAVPPMPPVPRRSPSTSSNTQYPKGLNTRVVSAHTIFDEDDNSNGAWNDRRWSSESQLRILKRSSTDTIATRHRSQGWWNHIVSPFLPKPGSVPWRSASRAPEPVPDLPELAPSTPLNKAQDATSPRSLCSSRRSSSGHTSILTDFSSQKTMREPTDITMLHSPFHEETRGLEDPDKDLSDWFAGLGAAAEYYHACWHDQKSSAPYFKCQNHVCVSRRLGNFPLPQGFPAEGTRDLPLGAGHDGETSTSTKHDDNGPNGFQQTPANRFSAAFREAMSPKSKAKGRPLSETTEIEDVDATPVVHQAQAAPIVRAPPPVPAAQPPLPIPASKDEAEAETSMSQAPVPPRVDSRKPPRALTISNPAHSPPAEDSSRDPDSSETTKPAGTGLSASSPKAEKPMKRFVAVMPPDHPSVTRASPLSPSPVSPTVLANDPMHNRIPLTSLAHDKAPPPGDGRYAAPTTVINHFYSSPQRSRSDQVTLSDMEPPPRPRWSPEHIRLARENEKDRPHDTSKQGRGCPPNLKACLGRGKPKTKKQKWLLIGITSALVFMIILILLLAMLLTRKGDTMEVQSQWLNLTGFPPIPTGISTVIQPDVVQESSACIHPATLWSCAVPKEQQAAIAPNNPNQPNFRLGIRFQNSSVAQGGASNNTSLRRRSGPRVGNAVTARSILKKRFLDVRDFTSNLFTPSPTPPAREDQIFLGNTTDKNQQPFDGEATPFFISFIDAKALPSLKLSKRDSISESNVTANGTDQFPDLDDAFPRPSTNADGTASPAVLYPLASAQPLRLYNRDTDTEHYGFYIYFDRSIFLKSSALINFTNASPSEIPEDENGGAEESAAKVRCTWAQTRFLVQIWTRKGDPPPLLQSSNSSSSSGSSSSSPDSQPKNLTESSANNFTRPGSFPYPISITLDRHGGDIKKKMIYCYALDQKQHPISSERQIQLEDRGFGGTLVNPTSGPFGNTKVSGDEGGPGGIDGGSGGCGCRWENFSGGRGEETQT